MIRGALSVFCAAVVNVIVPCVAESVTLPPSEDVFRGALWIGEADEKVEAWRQEDAKLAIGMTGSAGHHFKRAKDAVPLPKHCPRFRKTFPLDGRTVKRATAYVSGMGFYELWLNGRKVDQLRVLAPGMTKGDKVLFDRYDVTVLLRNGADNTLGLWLAPGYSDDFSAYGWTWLAPKRAILKLAVEFGDGTCREVCTDGSWEFTQNSPILHASIYHGEIYDAAREDSDWATPNGKKDGWRQARTFPDGPPLVFNSAPPVRMSAPLKPEKITETSLGVYTIDFGQNRAGFVSVRAKGEKGTSIRIRTSELLGKNGKIDPWTNRSAKSTDEFRLAGTGDMEEYAPRFTYHGFRYAEISGLRERPSPEDVTAWAVCAAVKQTADFRCSDETLMKLHNAAKWTMLSNFMSYPTDCPMRDERTPCRMDSQAYEDTACQFFDMRSYYNKWLVDISDWDDGNPDMAADIVSLPMRLWRHYGDLEALARHYPQMKRYVDLQTIEHPDFIFSKGFGDWCAPNKDGWLNYFRKPELVNSAIFCECLNCVATAALALGLNDDAEKYAKAFADAKEAFNRRLFDSSKATYGDGTQTELVLPLAFKLVPEECRGKVESNLVKRITNKDGGKIDTGIFGTRYIGDVLCDMGKADLLLDMYTQPEYPGFGYLFANGATTLWEQWAFRGEMHSHNHAMFSGGVSCFYSHLAGIRPLKPGYAEILVKPCFPGKLDFVEAMRLTPHGKVNVRWERSCYCIKVHVTIPADVSAAIFEFQDGTRRNLSNGNNEFEVQLPVVAN